MKALISGSRKSKMLTYWLLDNLHEEHKFTEITVNDPTKDKTILDWAYSRRIPINDRSFPPEIYRRGILGHLGLVYASRQFKPDVIVLMNVINWNTVAALGQKALVVNHKDTYG